MDYQQKNVRICYHQCSAWPTLDSHFDQTQHPTGPMVRPFFTAYGHHVFGPRLHLEHLCSGLHSQVILSPAIIHRMAEAHFAQDSLCPHSDRVTCFQS